MSDSNRESGYSFDLTMLVGAALTVIALCVFLFFLGVKYGADSERPQQQAASGASKANENAKLGCLESQSSLNKIDCLAKQIAAERESKRAEYDLAAQQQMADWALLMVIITGVQAILSLGGIYLLVRNLNLTREATNAAIESNKVAREIGQAQARAYLSIVEVILNFNQDAILARANIKNSGQSPARDVVIKGKIFAGFNKADGKGGKIAVEKNSVFGLGKQSIIAANSEEKVMLTWNQVAKTKPFHLFVANSATRFNFSCNLRWVDAFGGEQSINCVLAAIGGEVVKRPEANMTGRATLSVVQYTETIYEND